MQTHYILKSINAQFSESGVRVTYGVEIYRDDNGRYIGQEGHVVASQEYLALIQQAAVGALPLMDAQVGMPGRLPSSEPPTYDTATVAPAPDTGADDATA